MIHRSAFGAQASELGPRQVRVICSTEQIDRAGESVVQSGIDLSAYRANPVVLWQHDPAEPIARAVAIDLVGGQLHADVEFPPEGISAAADKICGLIKSGVINAVSIGFNPLVTEPMDPANPGTRKDPGPQRYLKSELMEFSFVSVPANPGALIVARRHAEVIMTDSAKIAAPVRSKTVAILIEKGLYGVGRLAALLAELGWAQEDAQWEAAYEEDNSQVPAMLGAALQQLGAVLIAMTQEEVAELIASFNLPEALEDLPEPVLVMTAATPPMVKFMSGLKSAMTAPVAVIRSGKAISKANVAVMQAVLDSHKALKTASAGHTKSMKALAAIMPEEGDAEDDEDTQDTQSTGEDADVDAAKAARARKVRALAVAPG